MGSVELFSNIILIRSNIITYGNSATPEITERIRMEIESMWNEPGALVSIKNRERKVVFEITCSCLPSIEPIEIFQNLDPRNNYFRIEEFAHGNISFVDGLLSNTGYFKLENLYQGSTTAAHEYGHTIGLDHPTDLDLRGKGVPGIMYPRGTLVDPEFQYDPAKTAGEPGGTMHPMYRKVLRQDIIDLRLHKLNFKNDTSILGEFTNIWHDQHQ